MSKKNTTPKPLSSRYQTAAGWEWSATFKVWQTSVIYFFNDDTIISIDEYLSDNHTRDKANDYPTDIGNYFVNKDRMDAIPIIKKKRTIIVIVEE